MAIVFSEEAAANDLAARLIVEEGWTLEKALEQTGIATEAGVKARIPYHQQRQKRHAVGDVGDATRQMLRHSTDLTPHIRVRPLRPS